MPLAREAAWSVVKFVLVLVKVRPLARETAWSVVKFVLVLVKGRPLARETAWSRSVSNSQICFGTGQRSAFST